MATAMLARRRIDSDDSAPIALVGVWLRNVLGGNQNPFKIAEPQGDESSKTSRSDTEGTAASANIGDKILKAIRRDARSGYFDELVNELRSSVAAVPDNWNGYGSPSPNATALALAERVLAAVDDAGFRAVRVMPSADGGVGIIFRSGTFYADIECYNSNEIVGTLSNRKGSITTFDIDPKGEIGIARAAARIRAFLQAGSSAAHVSLG
jgi:hypothetical protein